MKLIISICERHHYPYKANETVGRNFLEISKCAFEFQEYNFSGNS